MIAIPGIEDCFLRVEWHSSGLVEGRLGVVRLSRGALVEGLEIYGPPEGTIFLWADYHLVAPRDCSADGHSLQHAQPDVPVKAGLHLFLPV